jgi:hypothetical protein
MNYDSLSRRRTVPSVNYIVILMGCVYTYSFIESAMKEEGWGSHLVIEILANKSADV